MSLITRRTRVAAAAMATAAMVALAGCSSDDSNDEETPSTDSESTPEEEPEDEAPEAGGSFGDLEADEIGDQALDALLGADSLRMAGSVEQAGDEISLDLHLSREGDCAGSVSVASQGSFEIIKLGDEVWMKPDTTFWQTAVGTADQEILTQIDGFYLYGPANEAPMNSSAESCNLETFLGSIGATSSIGLTKGEETDVNGTPVLTLHDGEDATILVASEGEPYPLRIESSDPSAPSVIDFSAFDEPVPTDQPAAEEVITIEDLQSGAFLN
ncbi:hypothetical protein [Streptomyces profundus]|uniref:hypothetical protein n=1 Tax=Streptomyces profundus TaxID=2867410 RepID=UPI001D168B25|nr:hypothetical protein [Streptomyces sp. MA3_2.13]UED85767.1 hypothetical protein K4G22_17505 [Streptomyces sp. MA3_2.13]